ncbi:uncharacterized protein LOC122650028 isoform X1 [Telopea speciosissima]|uniref:uncharacterized protein LOC122650028 isoform X1 n=1 Tax=Telopea speciosissima TaxID=54955 RepID=UPI001CC7B344|nr:uncharacterized protein LOC122650028 isoform X1 [Telopea speciosissima]
MLTDDKAEKKWRENNVEGDDGLRTVECLRGRLLAERTASRVAKEEAELMQNKLIELERQLKAEIESKNRAEKKLKFLTKKLESLKLSPISDQLSSSETNPGSWGSGITGYSYNNCRDCSPEEPSKVDDTVTSKEFAITADLGLRESSNGEKESSGENDPVEYVDNSLAIVPVNTPTAPKQSQERKIINRESVGDVLAALRNAREKLHSSMRRRDGNHGFHSCSVELCG